MKITIRPKDWLVADYYQAQMRLVREDIEPTGARSAIVKELRRIERMAKGLKCDIRTQTVYQTEIDSEVNQPN